MKELKNCWCGNSNLNPFSPDYMLCNQCNTLVSQAGLDLEKTQVNNDETDFYGKEYWFSHQINDLEYPTIIQRARHDLTERCLHWLRTLLKYKLPPAKSLELGCSHGGFVALLQETGFNATGLEMSPWIVEFAKKTFAIPMLLGPLETQNIPPGSFDIINLFDVMEHLADPQTTIKQCFSLLKPDGVLVVQMPNFQPEKTYSSMFEQQDPFLSLLKADEHIHLFSKQAVEKFFYDLFGKVYIAFEPAIFSHYDMFFVVSREPFSPNAPERIEEYLNSTLATRVIQAMLDLAHQRDTYIKLYQEKTKHLELLHARVLAYEKNLPTKTLHKIGVLKKLMQSLFSRSRKLLFNRHRL